MHAADDLQRPHGAVVELDLDLAADLRAQGVKRQPLQHDLTPSGRPRALKRGDGVYLHIAELGHGHQHQVLRGLPIGVDACPDQAAPFRRRDLRQFRQIGRQIIVKRLRVQDR